MPSQGAKQDKVTAFLVGLATDPAKLGRFIQSADAELDAAGIDAADRAILKSGNAAAIHARIGGQPAPPRPDPMFMLVSMSDDGEGGTRPSVAQNLPMVFAQQMPPMIFAHQPMWPPMIFAQQMMPPMIFAHQTTPMLFMMNASASPSTPMLFMMNASPSPAMSAMAAHPHALATPSPMTSPFLPMTMSPMMMSPSMPQMMMSPMMMSPVMPSMMMAPMMSPMPATAPDADKAG